MKVCIIGAGAAGLCAAKHCLSRLKNLERLIVYEQAVSVGGTWLYTDSVGTDSLGLPIHSSMYKNLKTNLPKEVMSFPDFPFPQGKESFVTHQSVLQYLSEYSVHFGIQKHIKFRHTVLSVKNVSTSENSEAWKVESKNLLSNEQETFDFDCVFVCNGHYFVPKNPKLEGQDEFRGLTLHSHDYRVPHSFSGQRVACLGSGSSGVDIAVELAGHCSKVYLCHDLEPLQTFLFPNMSQKPGIKKLTKEGAILKNGETLELDSIIFCTGYHYSFPFLNYKELPLNIVDQRITPLYQHLVHIEHPSLFLVGLCTTVCPFPQFDVQVQYCISVLNGEAELPTKEAMYAWQEEDYRMRMEDLKLRKTKAHFLGPHQWEYNRNLSFLGGFPCPIAPNVEKLYNEVHNYRVKNVTTYKAVTFDLVGRDEFRLA